MSSNPFSWKSLRRSLSSLSLNSKDTPDLTSMEVQRKTVRTITHQSSSSLLNVNLASSKAFVPITRAPPAPGPPIILGRDALHLKNKRRPPPRKGQRRVPWKKNSLHNSRDFANHNLQGGSEMCIATGDWASEAALGHHLPQEWFEFEDTWGALFYIMSQPVV